MISATRVVGVVGILNVRSCKADCAACRGSVNGDCNDINGHQ